MMMNMEYCIGCRHKLMRTLSPRANTRSLLLYITKVHNILEASFWKSKVNSHLIRFSIHVLIRKPSPHHENNDHHIQRDQHETIPWAVVARHPPTQRWCSSKVGIGRLLQPMVGRYISDIEHSGQVIARSSITADNMYLLYPIKNKHANKIILPDHNICIIIIIQVLYFECHSCVYGSQHCASSVDEYICCLRSCWWS